MSMDTHTQKKITVMAHLVAGYPNEDASVHIAKSLVDGGASLLEIQLPFSDPSADGPAIQNACSEVLANGFSTKRGLSVIQEIHRQNPGIPIFLMTYASLAWSAGIDTFVRNAAAAGVSGIIVPDLPFDHDEGLKKSCDTNGIHSVPVAAPFMEEARLKKLVCSGYTYIYAPLRAGITGTDTEITAETIAFIQKLSECDAKVFGGFGIKNAEQSEKLAPYVYAVVAGSVFVRIIAENVDRPDRAFAALKKKAEELSFTAAV